MKKTSILTLVVSVILTLIFIYSLFFVKTTFTVTFTNNNETVETIKVVKGETIKLPENPTEEGKKLLKNLLKTQKNITKIMDKKLL